MSISKEQIETRKSELEKDFQMVKQQIEDSEVKVISMKNNLNALDSNTVLSEITTENPNANIEVVVKEEKPKKKKEEKNEEL